MRRYLALVLASLLLAMAGWGVAGAKHGATHTLKTEVRTLQAKIQNIRWDMRFRLRNLCRLLEGDYSQNGEWDMACK